MRKIAILLTASAALLLAGAFAFTVDAMTGGGGTLGLRSAAKNYSPIDTIGCRVAPGLRARTDLGLPAAAGLLVRPLPLVA